MASREQVQIEQQFFRRAFHVALPAVERILLSFFRPREIKIASQPIRNGKIRLQNASQHFLIELLLKRLRGLQNGVGISVLGLQVVDDFRILLMAQPGVMVYAAIVVQYVLHRFPPGNRGLGNRSC